MKRTIRRQLLEFLTLYVPILYFVHTSRTSFDVGHRSTADADASNEYIETSKRFKLTLEGTPRQLPNRNEKLFLEHTLFSYLNKALNPLSIRIQDVTIDDVTVRVRDGSSSFTVISHISSTRRKGMMLGPRNETEDESYIDEEFLDRKLASSPTKILPPTSNIRRKGEMLDPQDEVDKVAFRKQSSDRGLVTNEKCETANKLFVEIDVSGQDYTMKHSNFKYKVKHAINGGGLGQNNLLIQELVEIARPEPYFQGVCKIMADFAAYSTSKGNVGNTPAQKDPAELFSGRSGGNEDKEEDKDLTMFSSEETTETNDDEKDDTEKNEKKNSSQHRQHGPMYEKALRFRTISGSIFISLCITAVLANAIRILGKQREQKKQRMAKAKQAYEVPKQAELKRKSGEKFVGMLDNGAIPTR